MSDLNPENLIVGTSYGPGLWVAEPGTERPDVDDIDEAVWRAVGYLSADESPTVTVSDDSTPIYVWRKAGPLKKVLNAKTYTIGFTLLEISPIATSMWLDTIHPDADVLDDFDLDLDATIGVERAVLLQVIDGDQLIQYWFPNVVLTNAGEMTFDQGDATAYSVELTVLQAGMSPGRFRRIVFPPVFEPSETDAPLTITVGLTADAELVTDFILGDGALSIVFGNTAAAYAFQTKEALADLGLVTVHTAAGTVLFGQNLVPAYLISAVTLAAEADTVAGPQEQTYPSSLTYPSGATWPSEGDVPFLKPIEGTLTIGATGSAAATVVNNVAGSLSIVVPRTAAGNVPGTPSFPFPLMGISASDEYHGGPPEDNNWAAWRCYSQSDVTQVKNGAGPGVAQHFAVTIQGNIYTSATTAANAVENFLTTFYSGSTWDNAKVFIANGNEHAKDVTPGNLTGFLNACKAMYDKVHEESSPGVRRWPNAYFGLNPTHYQEQTGGQPGQTLPNQEMDVHMNDQMDPLAEWLDFIAFNSYPPGREDPSSDPTYDYPNPSTPYNLQAGWMERCLQRVLKVKNLKRTRSGDPDAEIFYATWETGIGKAGVGSPTVTGGSTPDPVLRPFYACHIMARYHYERATALGLKYLHNLWWDQQVVPEAQYPARDPNWTQSNDRDFGFPRPYTNARNILTDEWAAANPKIREVWKNPWQFIPEYGGTKPASWPEPAAASTPPARWKDRGSWPY